MKRFWTEVAVVPAGGGHGIALDGRPVRTPARAPLVVPTAALADAIADEWRAAGEEVDPRAMPMTGLANAAIDRVALDPAAFAASLAAYGESDVLYYRADEPVELAERQAAVWDALLGWARARYDVAFEPTTGIVHKPQPRPTLARLNDAVAARDVFQLAGLSPLVTISGSLVIALAVAERAIGPDAAFDAAHLDELWQAERWGEDLLAAANRDARRADFGNAARFLGMV